MKDQIVEEIRKFRIEIENEFDNNVEQHLQHIYEEQKKHGDKLILRKPRIRPTKKTA